MSQCKTHTLMSDVEPETIEWLWDGLNPTWTWTCRRLAIALPSPHFCEGGPPSALRAGDHLTD
jgi:hypothetical protein